MRRLGFITAALTTAAIATVIPLRRETPALPFHQWPAWAKETATSRQAADKGIGDTLVHLIGDSRSEAFQKRFEELIGRACGCAERQAWLNARFPYL